MVFVDDLYKNNAGVYMIYANHQPLAYIGSTINFYKRYKGHLKLLRGNKHHSKRMQRFVNKYGLNALTFIVVENVENTTELLKKEQVWLDAFKPFNSNGFNSAKKAGNTLGVPCSAETRLKISAALKGNKIWLGKHHTEESKRKISIGHKKFKEPKPKQIPRRFAGKKHTAEAKLKMSQKRKKKTVVQFNMYGVQVGIFASTIDAFKATNVKHQSISACCNNRRKSAGGFIWKFLNK